MANCCKTSATLISGCTKKYGIMFSGSPDTLLKVQFEIPTESIKIETAEENDIVGELDLLNLTDAQRCDLLGQKKYMLRDIKTRLWLNIGVESGRASFMPGGFGIPLLLSKNPNEYLPLRLLADPNNYLLATFDKKGIRVVTNPPAKFYKLELFIFNQMNIIGYVDESEKQFYIEVDDNGFVSSVSSPRQASPMEMLML